VSAIAAGPTTARLGEDDRGTGWVIFAGTLLLVLGCMNIIQGVGGVNGSHFFARRAHYIFGDLSSWGWAIWWVGIVQGLTALGVLLRMPIARLLGIVFAIANAVAQLLVMPAYPFLSLALFGLDIAVIYGLVVYGGRTYRPA
jgi:hypothetical protein